MSRADAFEIDRASGSDHDRGEEPTAEPATEAARCVVTERRRRREERRRLFIRGKLTPITDELLCEIEAERRRERAERRAR